MKQSVFNLILQAYPQEISEFEIWTELTIRKENLQKYLKDLVAEGMIVKTDRNNYKVVNSCD